MFTLLLAVATAAAPHAGAQLPAATASFDAGTGNVTVCLDNQELRFFGGFGREPTFHTTAGTHRLLVQRDTISWSGWVDLEPGRNDLSLWQPLEVTGVVFAPDGGTASGVRVQIESEQLTWSRHGISAPHYQRFGRVAKSDAGHFTTTVAEPGTYRLNAYAPSFGFAQVDIEVPGKPVRLTLEPGATLEVHAQRPWSRAVALNTPTAHWDHAEPIVLARTDAGVARFPNLRGRFVASEAYFPVAYGLAEFDGGSFTWAPVEEPRITGAVTGFVHHASPTGATICAEQSGGGHCGEIDADGGFSIVVQPGLTYDLMLPVQDQWLTERVKAKGGDHVEVHATRFKPFKVAVNDDAGKPIRRFTSSGKKLSKWVTVTTPLGVSLEAPGFLRRQVRPDPRVVLKEIRLARLPLEGSVHDVSGTPVAGAAVALHCSEEPEQPARLRRHDPDIGLPWWSYAPEALVCLVTYTQTDANGRFSFAQVTDYPGSVVKVEARKGQRSVVVPLEPGTPLDLVLP